MQLSPHLSRLGDLVSHPRDAPLHVACSRNEAQRSNHCVPQREGARVRNGRDVRTRQTAVLPLLLPLLLVLLAVSGASLHEVIVLVSISEGGEGGIWCR